MSLEKNVQTFLKQTPPSKKKLLLGFSGGEDSLALAYCLYRLGTIFELAHFDHGWREGSSDEAEQLRKWALSLKIPFNTTRSKDPMRSELSARIERDKFFEELFSSGNFAALLLAHHQQDQAETILKRVFEGAHLTTMKGMQPSSKRGSLTIYRPLLLTSKEEIRKYLEEHKLIPIEDSTNLDPKYLRGKMRTSLFPSLSKEYGKEITPSLIRLGLDASSLYMYMEEQASGFAPVQGPFGWMWQFGTAHPFLIEYVIVSFFRSRGMVPSRDILERILAALVQRKANHVIEFSNQKLIVDRGSLFWLLREVPLFPQKTSIKEGEIEEGGWRWKIAPSEGKNVMEGWVGWWRGSISLYLPEGEFRWATAKEISKKIFQECSVPAFLHPSLPIPGGANFPIKSYLKGEGARGVPMGVRAYRITLEHKNEI